MSTTSTTSSTSAPSKSGMVKIASGAIVCKDCELRGDITIGSKTVIHPTARIIAEGGPIYIGENNLIEEQVQIIHSRSKEGSEEGDSENANAMVIGVNNVFEVGAYCEATKIGDYNILESKCKVGKNVRLTTGCVIGAMCEVTSNEEIPENTVIFGRNCERRIQHEKPASQSLQLEFLTRILPNYHHLKKRAKAEPK